MNYTTYLNSVADKFQQIITSLPCTSPLHTDDYGWINHRYISDIFRLAHIERYSDGKIEVLHVTTFPHKWSPEPIFGFDVICTNNQIVGAYMDLSPGITSYAFDDDMNFTERKPLPEWATVFSDNFILLKPINDDEFVRFVNWTFDKYKWYVNVLEAKTIALDVGAVIEKQNKYCEVQASNPRTFNVLKHKIGEDRAKYFMQEILFPKISP